MMTVDRTVKKPSLLQLPSDSRLLNSTFLYLLNAMEPARQPELFKQANFSKGE